MISRRFTGAHWLAVLAATIALGSTLGRAFANDDIGGPASAGDEWINVIVKLEDAPVATYKGGMRGLAATSRDVTGATRLDPSSRAVRAYRTHLAGRQAAFERAAQIAVPGASTLYRYDMVFGGMAMRIPAGARDTLAALPGVRAVYRDEGRDLDTDKSPAFIGAKTLWGKAGGAESAGEGVIVGVLDTGIWPEHPSFADPDPSGKPYVVPPGTRGCQFSGGANPGAAFACNGKLIGAYRFQAGHDACGTCAHPSGNFSSARDGDGHGTHTASTAAGNGGVIAVLHGLKRGKLSGIAPRAHVIAYKVCGAGPGGCRQSDSVAAIQQAILDGVDVINYSVSGGENPYLDPVEQAFLDAYAAGIFVATSAGNNGPTASSVAHRGGWVTTVAASNQKRAFLSKIKLAAADGAKLKLVGQSIMPGLKEAAPVILGASVGDELCSSTTADAAFAGAIAACRTGGVVDGAKSFNVQQRGAVGILLYNQTNDPLVFTDNYAVPGVALADGGPLVAFLSAHTGVTASFTAGKAGNVQADVVRRFSSRGGPGLDLGMAKPDIAAPGEKIMAGDTPEHYDPQRPDGDLFQSLEGTSMASPHIAGAGALLRDLHPDWSPGKIKSAIMTTAATKKLFKEDGTTPADTFDRGSGRVALKTALNPGITFDVPAADYTDHAADLWTVNHPSLYLPPGAPNVVTVTRTAHSELAKDVVWKLAVTAPPDLPITVPPTITVPAGGDTSFTITVDKSALGTGVRHAVLTFSGKGVATFPISAVGPQALPDLVLTSVSASSPVTNGGPITLARTVQNIGAAPAAPHLTYFYLSTNDSLSADDIVFAFCERTVSTPVGGSGTCNFTATFTPTPPAAPGNYRVIVVADPTGLVHESNEDNNVAVVAGTFVVN